MEQHEKEMTEKIRRQMEEIEIPESLQPDKIEEILMRQQKKDRRKQYRYLLAAVACLGILSIVYIQGKVSRTKSIDLTVNTEKKPALITLKEEKKSSRLQMAKSYEEIYQFVKASPYYGEENVLESEEKVSAEVEEQGVARAENTYSKTNTREENVEEGDTVKTDGRYIYAVKEENEIGIVDTEGGLKQIAEITPEGNLSVSEIYVQGSYLIVLGTEREDVYYEAGDGWFETIDDYTGTQRETTRSIVYDISDKENPKELGENRQSGSYDNSRINNGYLYVFSQYYIYNPEEGEKEQYIPCVNEAFLSSDKICIPNTESARNYTVITAIDIQNPNEVTDSVGILSNQGFCYASAENIYLYETVWEKDGRSTEIRKFSYGEGKVTGVAETQVNGYLNDSFSIDEYKGGLRLVTTLDETNSNSVYVLDENLEETGKIENLAKDERIYSARFMGDIGYFVTYRETDPLFSVDLSDPANPKIIGELKIPGFSKYLHPYGEGLLLGIGMEVDENDVKDNRVKLSVFDISDPANVKEIDKIVLEDSYYSMAFDDYKSVLADVEKNLIGFFSYGERNMYHIYTYDRIHGFVCQMQEVVNGNFASVRGMYIGEQFYVIAGNQIEVYRIGEYEKIDSIVL